MVMENEIRLGDILDKLTPSDRLVIYNAARQVVYRGYAANAVHGTVNPQRRIKKMGLGMETLPERLEKVFIYRLAKKYGIVKENCGKVKFYFENIKTGGENEANE